MKTIKTILCTVVLMCACMTSQAQDNVNGIGFNLGYQVGSDPISNFGIGVKYDRFLSEALRGEVNGMYYLKNKNWDWYDVNVNFHYLFEVAPKTSVYPVFGFTGLFGDCDVKGVKSLARFGCNLGAGAQYNITDDFGVVFEAKYKVIKDYSNFNIAIGCVVQF